MEMMYTKNEAADMLGIHWVTLSRWMRKGSIEYVKRRNGRVLFKGSTIEKWLKGGEVIVNAGRAGEWRSE